MANVKNFGLIGVSDVVQFGKGGAKITQTGGAFALRNAGNSADASLNLAALTASTTIEATGSITAGTGLTVTTGGADITGNSTVDGTLGTGALTVTGGATVSTGNVSVTLGNITAAAGNIAATLGDVTAGGAMSAGTTVTAGTGITATTGDITASAGDVVLTAGDLSLSNGGSVAWNGDTSISRAAAGRVQLDGTSAVILPTGDTSQQGTASAGAFRFNSETGRLEYGNGTAWTSVATGGTAVTAVSVATANGFAGTSSGGTTPELTLTTTVTGVLVGNGTGISAAQSGTDLKTVGGNSIIGSGDVGTIGIAYGGTGETTASAAFNALAPTTTAGDLIYNNGSGNTRLAVGTSGQALVSTGTAPSWAAIVNSIDTVGTGISVTNTTGAVDVELSSKLQSVNDLASNGFIVQTDSNTVTARSITGTTDRIVVDNGDGVLSSPTIDLATVTQASSGDFVKVTLDGYGRVTGNTAVTTADITGLVDGTYVNVSGDTMTGNLSFGGTHTTTNLAEPTAASDAATKNYVDNMVTGLSWKTAVHVLGASNVPLTGSTPLVIDGQTLADGERVLLINQTDPYEDGIYTVTITGGSYTMARSSDADAFAELNGAAVFVQTGTVYADTGWVQTAKLTSLSTGDTQDWVQFSGAGVYSAGNGLLLTGTVFSVNMGAGITTLPSDEVGIDVVANKAIQLTTTDTDGQLTLVLDTGSGLEQSSSGLKISAAGVTNSMLANSSITLDADSGSGSVALGGTLNVQGTAGKITTSTSGSDITVTIDSTYVGQTSIDTVGTISTGTWQGSTIAVGHGGTGVTTTPLNGQLLIGNGTGYTVASLTAGTGVTITPSAGGITIAADSAASVSSVDTTVSGLSFTNGGVGATTLEGTVGAASGGTGLTSYTAGDILYASGATTLSKLAAGTSTQVLKGGTTPSWGAVDLTSDVTGVLPATNGGTGVDNGSNTITLAGNLTTSGANSLTLTTTGATNVTFPTSGTLLSTANIADNAVTTFQTSLAGLTPSTGTDGAVTLAGTLEVTSGGTGLTSVTAGQIVYGGTSSALASSSAFSFDGTDKLSVGTASIQGVAAGNTVIESSSGDVVLVPATGGQVVVGPLGAAATIQSDTGEALTINGQASLTLQSGAGVTIDVGTTSSVVTVTGATAAEYAAAIGAADLTNKQYVDDAIASGAAAGAIKAVQATVSLGTNGSTNIGTALPAGATILRVKVKVATTNSAATLTVGKSGATDAYMTAAENDAQEAGLYLAETFTTEGSSTQVTATVAGQSGGTGSATVIVEYQVAQ